MGRILGKQRYRDILLGLGLLLSAAALVVWPQQSMGAMKDGLKLCANVIVPSLFPFFVLSSLVVELGMSRYLGRLLEPGRLEYGDLATSADVCRLQIC